MRSIVDRQSVLSSQSSVFFGACCLFLLASPALSVGASAGSGPRSRPSQSGSVRKGVTLKVELLKRKRPALLLDGRPVTLKSLEAVAGWTARRFPRGRVIISAAAEVRWSRVAAVIRIASRHRLRYVLQVGRAAASGKRARKDGAAKRAAPEKGRKVSAKQGGNRPRRRPSSASRPARAHRVKKASSSRPSSAPASRPSSRPAVKRRSRQERRRAVKTLLKPNPKVTFTRTVLAVTRRAGAAPMVVQVCHVKLPASEGAKGRRSSRRRASFIFPLPTRLKRLVLLDGLKGTPHRRVKGGLLVTTVLGTRARVFAARYRIPARKGGPFLLRLPHPGHPMGSIALLTDTSGPVPMLRNVKGKRVRIGSGRQVRVMMAYELSPQKKKRPLLFRFAPMTKKKRSGRADPAASRKKRVWRIGLAIVIAVSIPGLLLLLGSWRRLRRPFDPPSQEEMLRRLGTVERELDDEQEEERRAELEAERERLLGEIAPGFERE